MHRPILASLVLLCCITTARALSTDELTRQPPCAALDSANLDNDAILAERIAIVRAACRLPVDDVTEQAARTALGVKTLTAVRNGDTLTVFARSSEDVALGGGGTLFGPLQRIGDSPFVAARFHLAELDRARISLSLNDQLWSWRGPGAPAAPVSKQDLAGRVVERTLYSHALGETRRLRIYLPPDYHEGGDYAAVFMGDGQFVTAYARLIEPLIDHGAAPPLVLVGAYSGAEGIVEDRATLGDIRALDYLPNYQGDTQRFPRHMAFFSQELPAYAVREFSVTRDARRRAVSGHSNAAALAFWAAYLHPEVFGNAIVMSQAWRPVDEITPSRVRARFFMNAGLYEQPFLLTTRRTAAALRTHGYEVNFEEVAGGHNDFTSIMFVNRLGQIF